jgi:frataxin-like iron-binding protein CyaY
MHVRKKNANGWVGVNQLKMMCMATTEYQIMIDARIANLEGELKNLDNLVDGLKEGIQEEFATVKFELDNAIIVVNKNVEDEVLNLRTELKAMKYNVDEEVLSLKTDLKALKRLMFGFLFVMAVILICKF